MRRVDIKWGSRGRLEASLRWTNKRGGITFFLVPVPFAKCPRCPFKDNPICGKWRDSDGWARQYNPGLCSILWRMKGDNQFEGREKISGWQPLGPIGRIKKNRKV